MTASTTESANYEGREAFQLYISYCTSCEHLVVPLCKPLH